MISGFNTDIVYQGVVYHVQTEDKGLETPLILSLVYTGGQILASKRTPYEDLLAAGFDEKVLAERLSRQHKLICAAIKMGRLEDLKRLGRPESPTAQPTPETAEPPTPDIYEAEIVPLPPDEMMQPPVGAPLINGGRVLTSLPEILTGRRPTSVAPLPTMPAPPGPTALKFLEPQVNGVLRLTLEEEKNFIAGTVVELQTRVEFYTEKGLSPASEAKVTVRLMGSSFKPLTYQTRAAADGRARLIIALPHFAAGRAIILVQAEYGFASTELRRIIQRKLA